MTPRIPPRTIPPLALLALILATAGRSSAQDPAPPPAGSLQASLRNDQPTFLVRAEVNHPSHLYQEGDALSIRVLSEEDAYLYVFYQQVDGKVFRIFPSRSQPENRVKAKEVVAIPGGDDLFRWRIGAPYGREVVKVVASRTPVDILSDPALRQELFTPVAAKQLKAAAIALEKGPPARWAESSTEIITSARQQEAPPAVGRRFGLFVGVTEYRHDPARRAAQEAGAQGISPFHLPGCDNDAREMARLFQKVGRLDGQRVLVNAQATRAAIEEAITRWLPSVSRPGDTVFIFHSGHGGQIADNDGDETQPGGATDGKDEFLLTNDIADFPTLAAYLKLKQQRNTPVDDQIRELVSLSRDAVGAPPEGDEAYVQWALKMNDFLVRRSGITDDLFGRWLQDLDGRQVIVILDICHSGGFATREKGVERVESALPFNFMDRELSRLKDIGQRNAALLAACAADTTSLVRVDRPISVMTSSLIEPLLAASGPIDLTRAFDFCVAGMRDYFESEEVQRIRRQSPRYRPHQPILYMDLTRPAYLKP